MAFADLASNQMVDENNAATGGFSAIGPKLSPANKCYTKAEALATYNLSPSLMSSYANNQLVPKSVWATGVVSYSYAIAQAGTNAAEACNYINFLATFYSNVSTLVVGSTWYSDPGLTTVVTGGNLWHQVQGSGNSYQVSNSGIILAITPCSSIIYGGAMTLNIPGYGNNVAPQPPGSGVISGYTLGSGITINNTSGTETVLFKSASLSNPYPILAQSGAARLMQYVSSSPVSFNTAPGDGQTIPTNSNITQVAFVKNSGSGLVVLSLETQTNAGGRQQVFWTFNI